MEFSTTPSSFNLVIGSYTNGGSEGIYIFRLLTESGDLIYLNKITGIKNPSYLCTAGHGEYTHLYAVSEVTDESKGSVSSFRLKTESGTAELVNKREFEDKGSCYITVGKDEKHLFVANYISGNLLVLPVSENGFIDIPVQRFTYQGSGPDTERQERPHVHAAVLSPDNRYLFCTDLGTDTLHIYRYEPLLEIPLKQASPEFIDLPPGSGPRHLTFSSDGRFMYLITELTGIIMVFHHYEGKLQHLQYISTVSEEYQGEIGGADVLLSPDERFLYACNRGDLNEIIVYEIDQLNGTLSFIQRISSYGRSPRSLIIDPSRRFLLAANQNSDNITMFKINLSTGELIFTGKEIQVRNPSCVKFAGFNPQEYPSWSFIA